jgi:hypothetical protein
VTDRPIILLVKASAIPAGARWITVHPHGADSKGQPVLIEPQPDGAAKVIGGAGGKLNHLRLTGVRKEGSYADTIRDRAAKRREVAKAQRERDKALGLQSSKAEAQRKVTSRIREVRRKFVESVAAAMGWDAADYRFDPEPHIDKGDEVVARLAVAHEKAMVKRAQEAVKVNRERLLADAAARAESGLGAVPLDETDPDKLSVSDLDQTRREGLGLGFAKNYQNRAEAAGAKPEEVKAEAEAARGPLSEAQRKAAIANGETAKIIRDNMEMLRDGDQMAKLAPQMVEAKKSLDLLKLEKQLKMAEAKAREARKDIAGATEEPKAFILEVDEAQVDEKVAEDIANDLRTISTRAFLAEAGKAGTRAQMARHIGSGAYNSVNALALTAGGAALVDRSVVDVLGVGGAATVLARRLATDLSPEEFKAVGEGVEDFHLSHYMAASEEAIGRAKELQDAAREMELGAAEHGEDLAAMQEINRKRGEALAESRKVLGTALGEMEANAALVLAMKGGKSDKPLEVSLGEVSTESAISQLRAIGLQRGDYTLETAAGNRVVQIKPQGLDRLAAPVNRADLEQVRRNLDIISGVHDEDNWLPIGFANRPDLGADIKPGAAPSLAVPFGPGPDLEAGIRDYIGGRAADGDTPADIVADLQSADFFRKVGPDRSAAYRAALDKLAPLTDDGGTLQQAEALRPAFESMADAFVADRYGADRSPLHRQTFAVDDTAADALHRALAAEPAGVAAYKPIGEMTPHDQRALREHFAKHIAKESPEAAGLRHTLERLESSEPEREVEDMFGDKGTSPEWTAWSQQKADLSAQVSAASVTWPKYVEAMHGPEKAYAAMQDVIRSSVSRGFADNYNRLKPDAPLKVGRAAIRENLNHLDAVDPKARDARLAKERALTDSLRDRVAGKYASGSVRDKLDRARDEEAGLAAAQMGFFSSDEAPAGAEAALEGDERWTLGHAAERQIAGLMPTVGANFKPGQPVRLGKPEMSGGKNAPRQRAIKMVEANKRAVLSFGTGSGKTAIGLGAFTHLHAKGKVKRGLFLAPSIAQGGFGADALKYLKPGAYKWHCQPGAGREERLAAYRDPSNHFAVMTHQAFRDDMLHLGAGHAGISEEEMSGQLATMDRKGRADWLRGVMRREGISFDYLNVDEGHDTLNRKGKENSGLANVVDAMGDIASHYVSASADPVKNDYSEAFSLLSKMDPERYTDEAAFTRRYGVDTLAAKDSLRRELARFQYPSKIDPDITATRSERKVEVTPAQRADLEALDGHMAAARIARMQGKVDVAALKAISPSSFEGVPADQHEALAGELSKSLGILKQTAVRHLLDSHPEGGKIEEISKVAREHAGKPGVVFAHSLEAVEGLRKRLASEGYRVGTITGKDSARDKAKRIAEFNPAAGAADLDIMICSDAGATGANLQSGRWLANFDTPMTAKTHAQRNGRINRIGQTNDVDLIDLVTDHPEEARNRDRLTRKYALRDMMTTPMESLDDTGLAHFIRQRQIARAEGGVS